MTGAVGGAGIKVTIAGRDVSQYVDELQINNSVLRSGGPGAQISLVDPEGISSTITGDYSQDVLIDIIGEDGSKNSYKLKLHAGNNVGGEEGSKQGSGKYKRVSLQCVSPEERNVHGNYAKFAKEDSVTNIMKKTLEDCYKTEDPVTIDDPSKGKRHITACNKHGYEFMNDMQQEAVSQKNKGNAYCVFKQQNGGSTQYKITTFEESFKKTPVADLTYSTTNQKGKTNILNYDVATNFTTVAQQGEVATESSFNPTTHGVSYVPSKQNKFVLPGKENPSKNPNLKEMPVHSIVDKKNESEAHETATAKVNRAQFLRRLSENSAQCSVTWDPEIDVGKMVNFNLPPRTADASGSGGQLDSQFAGPVLVTDCVTRVVQADKAFRVTKELTLAKGSFNA